MTPRRLLAFALGGLFLVLLGCGTKKNHVVPDLPPETIISVQSVATDTLHPVNHLIRLHWFGSDPDGRVVAFELRMRSGLGLATPWTRIDCTSADCTDSLFTIHSPTGYARDTLEVRAIDNENVADESPAVQAFAFLNRVPTVTFLGGPAPSESTYASATFSWNVDDPGGDLGKMSFRVYLDGNAATYDSVYSGSSTATFTIPSARFVQGGMWKNGPRTLSVQAVDDGGQVGPAATRTWYVRSPGSSPVGPADIPATTRGRILLIDNSLRTALNNQRVDTLYSNTLLRNLPNGTYSILRLEYNNAFRSAQDLAQTFRQFDAVVWYRGYDLAISTVLTAFQDSVGAYLDHGGSFYLEGLNMFEGPGLPSNNPAPMLRETFITNQLHCLGQRRYYSQSLSDSSVAWGNLNNDAIPPPDFRSSALADTFRLTSALTPEIRVFVPLDTTDVAFWAKPNALVPQIPENMAVIMNVRQPSGGRFMVVPLPVRHALLTYVSPSRILAKLIFHPTAGLLAP